MPPLGKIFLKVIKNPIINMVILGIAFNFAVDADPPKYIHNTMNTLALAFTACALINLGGNMAGGMREVDGPTLVTMLLTISAKTVLLPILVAVLLKAFSADTVVVDGEEYSLLLFGFILGTVPTASGVFLFSMDFGILTNEIPAAVVLCTLVSAPLMVVSAQLAELSITGVEEYRKLLQETSDIVGVVSLVCALILLAMYFAVQQTSKAVYRFHFPLICGSIIYFSSMLQTCYIKDASADLMKVDRHFYCWCNHRCSSATFSFGLVCTHCGCR